MITLPNTAGFEQFGVATESRQTNVQNGAHTGINEYGYDMLSSSRADNGGGIRLVSSGGTLLNVPAADLASLFGMGEGAASAPGAGGGTYADRSISRDANGRPIIDYSPSALLDSLPGYNQSYARMLTTEPLSTLLLSGEYDWFAVGVPPNGPVGVGGTVVQFRATNRYQVSVPPNSILLGIAAYSTVQVGSGELQLQVPTPVMVQIFDDGAGEYFSDKPITMALCAGAYDPTGMLGHLPRGIFWLPSCLTVCRTGILTVSATSRATNTNGDSSSHTLGATTFAMSLYFAVPKPCKGDR